ncbi:MAG TPA: Ku protein [Nitrospiraceae bacterium]|nr:Ku protein [Nitrospiraceae bacterium]
MPRSLWKGAISFGLVNIPVVLYSAENRNSFDLTMLDRRDMKPVGFKRYNKDTGKDVPWEDIVKGYEYEKDRYVVLTDEDFRRANVEATQTVDIASFVDAEEIPPIYFETPYYLAPDKRGEKGYVLLRETLKKTHKVALATVVIRTRQYVCALIPRDDVIVLHTLRYANELKSTKDLEVPSANLKTIGVTAREIEMAAKLVEEMTDEWNPEKFRDTYHDDLMKLIETRIRAGQTEVISEPEEEGEPRAQAEVIDLMALLKKSVKAKEQRNGQTHRGKRTSSRRHERTARRKSA